jgi:putative glycosyl hydrolase-like family 6 (GHL6) protein
VDGLKALGATVAMINTSGIVASYRTTLPFQTPSAFLQGDDFETIIGACHAAGIRVIARTDFSKIRRVLFQQHPEGAYRRPDGRIVDQEGDPEPGDEPGLVTNRFGAGRAVYVPWGCGALVHRHGHANASSFMADVVEHEAGLSRWAAPSRRWSRRRCSNARTARVDSCIWSTTRGASARASSSR